MVHALFSVQLALQSLTQPLTPLCRKDGCFSIMPSLVPVNLKHLTCGSSGNERPDVALLSRLTQLESLSLGWGYHWGFELTQPLPQLPALLSLHVWTRDFQTMLPVAATLQELHLFAVDIDFRPPNSLTRFTRLHALTVETKETCDRIRNFSRTVLPPTLCSITMLYARRFQRRGSRGPDQVHQRFDFPAGGHVVKSWFCMQHTVRWTRHAPL